MSIFCVCVVSLSRKLLGLFVRRLALMGIALKLSCILVAKTLRVIFQHYSQALLYEKISASPQKQGKE